MILKLYVYLTMFHWRLGTKSLTNYNEFRRKVVSSIKL